jgi:hypothetical protein
MLVVIISTTGGIPTTFTESGAVHEGIRSELAFHLPTPPLGR